MGNNLTEFVSDLVGEERDRYAVFGDGMTISVKGKQSLSPHPYINSIAFVDGGQGILMSSSAACIALIRAGYSIFEKGKHSRSETTSFYLYLKAKGDDYHSSIDIIKDGCGIGTILTAAIKDVKIPRVENGRLLNPENATSQLRRICELSLSEHLTSMMPKASMIVLDGDLESRHPYEKRMVRQLSEAAEKNLVLCASLAKSVGLTTDDGIPLTAVVAQNVGTFFVEADNHHPKTALVRLHAKSAFVFKFQALSKEANLDLGRALASLAAQSKDASFPGYPYGLIRVDRIARVSLEEVSYHKTKIVAQLGKEWKKYRLLLDSPDAHAVLDSLG